MSEKWFWAGGCFAIGGLLCVYGSRAFSVAGIIIGVAMLLGGVVLIKNCLKYREGKLASILLTGAGVLTVLLCALVTSAAFFVGGLIFLAAALAALIYSYYAFGSIRLIVGIFSGCLTLAALVLIFCPPWHLFCFACGGGLVIFGGAFVIFL